MQSINNNQSHYFNAMQQNDKIFKQSQSQYINYENKENNQQQQYSTPTRSNSNNEFGGCGNKMPLSPLSPQPMMLSPNEKMMILSPPKLSNRIQNQQHHSLMLPPPSNIANGIPIQKRPTSNLFEYVSKQVTTTTSLNNSTIMMLPPQTNNTTTTNNLNNEFTFVIPQSQSTKSTPSSSNNNTLNRKSAQQLKTFSKNGEEDHFSTKKREDRKSHQLSRQSSKRDVLIQNSRQQQLNQRSLSPPKQTQQQIQQSIEEQQRIQHELKQQQLQEFLIKEKKRIESIKEVYSSEYTYCNHLNTIIENYLLPLRREYTTPEEVRFIVCIFSNIEEIRSINNGILLKIKDRIGSISSSITSSHSLMISDLFIDSMLSLESYIEYYVNYYRSLHSLDVWFGKCKKLKKFLDHDTMILKSLLIMPIQRIPRYSLLIDAVIRFTSITHPDYQNLQLALEKMKQLTERINERIRHQENIQKVTNIKFKFNDTIGFLDQTHRLLIKDSDNTLQLQPFKSVNLYNSNNNIDINNNEDTNSNSNKDSDDLTDDEDYGSSNLILNSSFKRSISSIPVTPKKQQQPKKSTLSPSDCSLYLFNDTLLLGITSQHSNTNNNVVIADQQLDSNGNEIDGRDQITSSSGSSNGSGNSVIVNYKYNVVLKSNLVETFIRDYPKLAPTIFSIHHNSGTYLISTQTIEQRESWVREINDTINKLINSDQSLANRRSKISLKGTDDYGWYAFDSECSLQDTTLISRSLKELEENQIFTPKKRKSMITKVKQRMSSALSSPHKNQNVKRNSSFVLNSLVE